LDAVLEYISQHLELARPSTAPEDQIERFESRLFDLLDSSNSVQSTKFDNADEYQRQAKDIKRRCLVLKRDMVKFRTSLKPSQIGLVNRTEDLLENLQEFDYDLSKKFRDVEFDTELRDVPELLTGVVDRLHTAFKSNEAKQQHKNTENNMFDL
jgi:hypothetical protein